MTPAYTITVLVTSLNALHRILCCYLGTTYRTAQCHFYIYDIDHTTILFQLQVQNIMLYFIFFTSLKHRDFTCCLGV